MPLLACEGCLKDIFVTETEFINRFTGQQLFTWGRNNGGQLGINSLTPAAVSSPVQTVSSVTNWRQISGQGTTFAAIKTDGTLWTWGFNSTGELGNQSTISSASSPIQTISGGTNWRTVSHGSGAVLAIKTDGTLWTWGSNSQGQLGDNSSVASRSSPVQTAAGGTNWKSIAGSDTRSSGIKTDGTLWIWGNNASGIMGDNTTVCRSSPVQTITGGTNWKQASIGSNAIVAVKTDGTLWTWGSGAFGQLGTENTTSRSSPGQTVAGGNNWKQVSAGEFSMGAIKTDGTLWTWGRNSYGQLGSNNTFNRSSPAQTVTGGTNWSKVSMYQSSGGIKTDGTLWMWGQGDLGGLGNNATTNRSSPVQTITGGASWRDILPGQAAIALKIEE